MSEVEATEVPETGDVSVDDVLQAIQQKNIGQARAHFNDVMTHKIGDALEAEKVRLAASIYSPEAEEEPEEPIEAEVEDEVELSLEDEEEVVEEE